MPVMPIRMGDVAASMSITIKVTGQKRFRARTAVAMWAIRLGALLLPVKASVEVVDDPEHALENG
ncbi:MAG: hypothetical protein JWQ03_3070 [Variovorax sp.]|nr:hypothetical protein [Variovorax sp.]